MLKEMCSSCKGTGVHTKDQETCYWCKKCKGVGMVDWLEEIFGKNDELTDEEISIRDKNVGMFYIKVMQNRKECKKDENS